MPIFHDDKQFWKTRTKRRKNSSSFISIICADVDNTSCAVSYQFLNLNNIMKMVSLITTHTLVRDYLPPSHYATCIKFAINVYPFSRLTDHAWRMLRLFQHHNIHAHFGNKTKCFTYIYFSQKYIQKRIKEHEFLMT